MLQRGITPLPSEYSCASFCSNFIHIALRWRQNGRDSVSNHQPRHCLLSLLFGRRSRKTSKLRVTGLCVGNSPGPVNSPHKGPVTRKMFPFDDVIMGYPSTLGALVASCRLCVTHATIVINGQPFRIHLKSTLKRLNYFWYVLKCTEMS